MPTVITGTDGVSQVQTGAVESGDLPAGSVIQVVVKQADATELVTTSSTYADIPGMAASITPTSSSNKVLVSYSGHAYISDGDSGIWGACGTRLLRNQTVIVSEDDASLATYGIAMSTQDLDDRFMAYFGNAGYLDSPNSTLTVNYKVQGAQTRDRNGQVEFNAYGQLGQLILMEIAG